MKRAGFVKRLLLIGTAGAFGAVSRMLVSESMQGSIAATFLVNMAGTFLLCFAAEYARATKRISELAVTVITTGFLGAFTTFSAVSLETVELIENGHFQTAVLYTASSIAGGLLMAALGIAAGRAAR